MKISFSADWESNQSNCVEVQTINYRTSQSMNSFIFNFLDQHILD